MFNTDKLLTTFLLSMLFSPAATAYLASLDVTVTSGKGIVDGSGISCGPSGGACHTLVDVFDILHPPLVYLYPKPSAGYEFSSWGGDCEPLQGNVTCTVKMSGAKSVSATFSAIPNRLSVGILKGKGGITSSPAGINCGSVCSYDYAKGTQVGLLEKPARGYHFSGWSGACSGTTACSVKVDGRVSVTAGFEPDAMYTLSVNINGSGSVTSSPSGIYCGIPDYLGHQSCSYSYDNYTPVSLTPSPKKGYTFTGWGGACNGTGTCSVDMSGNTNVTATFTPNARYSLTVTPNNLGTVTSAPSGINCGSDCNETYDNFTPVTLTATPIAGYAFTGWGGACSGTGDCTVGMSGNTSVTTAFEPLYTLDVKTIGQPGTVTSTTAGINCGSDCSEVYVNHSQVTLTATPPAGATFIGWGGPCSGWAAACTVDMGADTMVTAAFGPPLPASWPNFATLVSYPVLNYATDIVMGDLNGDGKPDLATAGYFNNPYFPTPDASVLLNKGAGAFNAAVNYDAGNKVLSIALGDLSGDNKADLVLVNDTGISLLTGKGDGTFTKNFFAKSSFGRVAATGDLNGDGKPDLALTEVDFFGGTPGRIAVYLNDGKAAGEYSIGAGYRAYYVAIGDLNGDGKPDIVTTTDVGVYVLFNKGAGVFQAPLRVSSQAIPYYRLVIGDLNADGKPDLAVTLAAAYSASGMDSVSVLLNNGTGAFQAAGDFPVTVGALALGDLNRDGKPDLAITNQDKGVVSILLNDGAAKFYPAIDYPVAANPTDIKIGDLNNDGQPDIAVVGGGTVSVLLNTTPLSYPLTVTKTGQGTVFSDLAGIGCGVDCSEAYAKDTQVTLTATPAAGYGFAGWSGACTGTGTCQVNMANVAVAVNANFIPLYTLAVTITGTGEVHNGLLDLQCTSDCSKPYPQGSDVTLFANPAAGYRFAGWGGACTGTDSCQVTMTADKNVTATFVALAHYQLSVAVSGQGGVASYPAGIACGSDCSESYLEGSRVTLVATPTAGYQFTGWSGACSDAGACQLDLSANQTVTATFAEAKTAFKKAVNYTTGKTPQGAAIGDLNGDGKLDLAIANTASGKVNVLLGVGNGTLKTAIPYDAGTAPQAVAISDVNRDGKPDLVVADAQNGAMAVLLGLGDGSFKPQRAYAVGFSPKAVVAADLNADAKPDLVVPDGSSGKVVVMLGLGDGSFDTAITYATGSLPQAAAVGDVNGDGKVDLVVANAGGGNVSVLLGLGDGTFKTAVPYTVGLNPQAVGIGDMNGDGKADVAIANADSATVSVLLGKGDGTFNTATHLAVGSSPQAVSVADINGDGKADLVAVNAHDSNVSVLLGLGDGSFKAPARYAAGKGSNGLAVGDLNGDGRPDFAVANQDGGNVSVLLNSTPFSHAGTFPVSVEYAVKKQPIDLAISDLNRDGKADIITLNSKSANVSVLQGLGNGAYKAAVNYPVGSDSNALAIADLNRDGNPDLAVTEHYPSGDGTSINVLLGQANGTFTQGNRFADGDGSYALVLGDLNMDGKHDLVTAGVFSTVNVLLGIGDANFQPVIVTGDYGVAHSIAMADVNRDGKPDMVRPDELSNTISILLGGGDGYLKPSIKYTATIASSYPKIVAVGDLNRDGKPDIVTANTNGDLSVLLAKSAGGFKPAVRYASGYSDNPTSLTIGDVNQDGKTDLVCSGYVNSLGDVTTILIGQGDGTFQQAAHYAVGGHRPRAVKIADVNRDGKPDLVSANADNDGSSISILINQ